MKVKFVIRKATLKDLEKFFKFFTKSISSQFPKYTPLTCRFFLEKEFSKKEFRQWLKKNKALILLAMVQERIVGHLLAMSPYGGVSFCSWIAVDEDFQGQGVGLRLLQKWKKWAQKQGAHKLHLWTDRRNLKFYKNCGFTLVGHIPNNFFGAHDYLFVKSLGKPKEENYLREFFKNELW